MDRKGSDDQTPYSWDEQTAALIDWFEDADLPTVPFRLRSGVEVTDPNQFYASLRNDIRQGVQGARARTGALQEDLEGLFDLFCDAASPQDPR